MEGAILPFFIYICCNFSDAPGKQYHNNFSCLCFPMGISVKEKKYSTSCIINIYYLTFVMYIIYLL